MIQVNNIYKSFGDLKVLDGVSFTVKEGEIVSIVGESGCGKTTILKCMSGLTSLDSGDVVVPDCISYVPQNLGLLPWRTVRGNINLPMEFLKTEGDVDGIIELMGLKGFEGYHLKQLSGGMAQRTAIGRALVTKPKIMFLDEPFKSLDEITRNRLTEELRGLWWKLETTVVLVTHSIREAIRFSDKIVVLSSRPATVKDILELPRSLTDIDVYNYEKHVYNILQKI